MVHARELDGRSLRFGHRGWLWHNAYLLYDRETDSIWHHQTGWAMSGPLRGKALARFPTVLTTFGAWTATFPDTLVLPKPTDGRDAFGRDRYADRNVGLAFGLGVDLPQAFRLYAFDEVDGAGGIVSEVVEGQPLVVVRDRPARSAYAYSRAWEGSVLELTVLQADDGAPVLVDRETERRWSGRSGRAIDHDGAPLRRLHASQWELHAWERQHPNGSRYPHSHGDAAVSPGGR